MASGFGYRQGELHCEGVPARRIAREAGTPAYVYSAAALSGALAEVQSAFGPKTLVCASVKACPSLAVLKIYAGAGAGFDVVSGGELRRARKAGGQPGRMVFAGVGKTDAEIREALEAGLLLLNAARGLGIPMIHGAVAGWWGQVCAADTGNDVLASLWESRGEKGVETVVGTPGFTPSAVASMQAALGIRTLLGLGKPVPPDLFWLDLEGPALDRLSLQRQPNGQVG